MKKDLQKYFIAFISIFFITFTFNIEAQNQSSDREVKRPTLNIKKQERYEQALQKKWLKFTRL